MNKMYSEPVDEPIVEFVLEWYDKDEDDLVELSRYNVSDVENSICPTVGDIITHKDQIYLCSSCIVNYNDDFTTKKVELFFRLNTDD